MASISSRKEQHVELCVNEEVNFTTKTNGLEEWEFEHNALPELNFDEINPSIQFLGKEISFPLLITGMTGGYENAESINGQLAEICEELSLAMGVGSQRQALNDHTFHASFAIARKCAPHIPLIANIGAAEVARMPDASSAQRLIALIEANALAVHLNPLQEFLQPEGNPEFKNVLTKIGMLVKALPVPVIVKEVGAGISASVATKLFEAGVRIIDVAGAGGTSWAGVEILRRKDQLPVSQEFWNWGIRTADAVHAISKIKPDNASVIASGGIVDGVMIAKSIALGADLAGAARILLQELVKNGQDGLRRLLLGWMHDVQGVMFLVGAKNIDALRRVPLMKADVT